MLSPDSVDVLLSALLMYCINCGMELFKNSWPITGGVNTLSMGVNIASGVALQWCLDH